MRSLIISLSVFGLYACTAGNPTYAQQASTSESFAPQYNELYYWAAHPWKQDPSDSVPEPLFKEQRDTLVDVFFVHPTTFTEDGARGNANIHNTALNEKTDGSTILFQASVFNQYARVFAPRYRQAHLSAFFADSVIAAPVFDTAYNDVKAAFETYLQQYHHERPIIIAAHSQGAKLAKRLLQEYFDGTALQSKLVAAYVVGWPVPKNQFEQLPVCAAPDQTGCFVTWRTFREGYMPEYILREEPESFVVNPLSWRTDNKLAPASMNKGSVLRNFNKIIPHTTDARIEGGVLWVSKPKFPGAFLINTPNYHIGDINLFYVNIRQNVAERIRAYFQQQANAAP